MRTVYWPLADGEVCLAAEVEDDAVFLGIGHMAELDDIVDNIDLVSGTFTTRKFGVQPLPSNIKRPRDCNWRVYRIGTKLYD